jgi:hypothetical protein
MQRSDIAAGGPAALGTGLVVVGGVGGWLVGEAVGFGLGFPLGGAAGALIPQSGQLSVIWSVAPFMVLLALALLFARSRPEAYEVREPRTQMA